MQTGNRESNRAVIVARRMVTRGLLAAAMAAALAQPASAAKNVIIMVSDGAGFNTWRATDMYQGKLGKQVFDGQEWVKLAVCTYPLNQSPRPKGTGIQDPSLVYDPAKAWSAAPAVETVPLVSAEKEAAVVEKEDKEDTAPDKKAGPAKKAAENGPDKPAESAPKKPVPAKQVKTFAGYVWLKKTFTDSAASATAMATGVKTYNNSINWSDDNRPLTGRTLAEIAKAAGKNAGVITTVPISHATPAGFGGAHSVTRNNYKGIANEMLESTYLDVIMGAGHPEFDDNGLPRATKRDYRYVGGEETWAKLKSGSHPAGWKLVETKADFEALAAGPAPRKVLGVAQAATTLQEKRKGDEKQPFGRPANGNVPTLTTLTKAAIHCLDANPQGFYLMIEGGAVDWANHSRKAPRMVEEQIDFVQAVEAVVQWVNTHSRWDETLVILTADHETGLIWGPDSETVAYQPIVDGGPGRLPDLKYNHKAHTNSLVPLFARGPGAERFAGLTVGLDMTAAAKWGISGRYLENTGIFTVANTECGGSASPPAQERK